MSSRRRATASGAPAATAVDDDDSDASWDDWDEGTEAMPVACLFEPSKVLPQAEALARCEAHGLNLPSLLATRGAAPFVSCVCFTASPLLLTRALLCTES